MAMSICVCDVDNKSAAIEPPGALGTVGGKALALGHVLKAEET